MFCFKVLSMKSVESTCHHSWRTSIRPATGWLLCLLSVESTRHVFAICPVLTINPEEGRRIAPCKFEANAPVRLPLQSSYWGGDGMTLMPTHVVVSAEGCIQRVEKTGKFKLGNTGGEGAEYQSLQDLGERTGAFTFAMAISGRLWQDQCCAIVDSLCCCF